MSTFIANKPKAIRVREQNIGTFGQGLVVYVIGYTTINIFHILIGLIMLFLIQLKGLNRWKWKYQNIYQHMKCE